MNWTFKLQTQTNGYLFIWNCDIHWDVECCIAWTNDKCTLDQVNIDAKVKDYCPNLHIVVEVERLTTQIRIM